MDLNAILKALKKEQAVVNDAIAVLEKVAQRQAKERGTKKSGPRPSSDAPKPQAVRKRRPKR